MTLEKEGLITLGATFDLMPSGPSIVARGRVISIHAMEEEEMMRTIFRARDD